MKERKFDGYASCLSDNNSGRTVIEIFAILDLDGTTQPYDAARITAVVDPSSNTNMATYSSCNYELDTYYAAMEPASPEYNNTIFGKRFGVLLEDANHIATRKLSNSKFDSTSA